MCFMISGTEGGEAETGDIARKLTWIINMKECSPTSPPLGCLFSPLFKFTIYIKKKWTLKHIPFPTCLADLTEYTCKHISCAYHERMIRSAIPYIPYNTEFANIISTCFVETQYRDDINDFIYLVRLVRLLLLKLVTKVLFWNNKSPVSLRRGFRVNSKNELLTFSCSVLL